MLLSDREIRSTLARGYIEIDPMPEDSQIQPASVDLTLGSMGCIMADRCNGRHRLEPGEFVLATTRERIKLPPNIAGRVEGRSTYGRKGLLIHCTAGFIDPGFDGQITLEIKNLSRMDIHLREGDRICQITFLQLSSPAERPYGHPGLGSKYQGQVGVTGARL